MTLARLTLCVCLLVWSPAVPAFDSELWPGEGIPRFAAKTDHLTLFKEPSCSSPVVTQHRRQKGEEISYDHTRFRTLRAGLVTAEHAGLLRGRSFGSLMYLPQERYYSHEPAWKEIPYTAGDSFEYLQRRAEGTCLIRHEGEVLEIEACPWEAGAQAGGFTVTTPPVTQWWIRVTDEHTQPLGWVLVDDKGVEVLPRKF